MKWKLSLNFDHIQVIICKSNNIPYMNIYMAKVAFMLCSVRTIAVLLHVTVLCQQQPHRLHKPHAFFSPHSFIYEFLCLFTFCPYSINGTGSTWKCMTRLVKKNTCVKILLHANIRAKKAALVKNYFSRRNNFCLSRSAIFDQINADVLFRRVDYLYLATFTCPIALFQNEWQRMGFKNAGWDLLKYTHGWILTAFVEDKSDLC